MSNQTAELRRKYFVGRKEAIEAFDQFIEDETKRIFLITGEGGIGKTWLLSELIEHTQKHHNHLEIAKEIIDLLSTQNHRISQLWRQIIDLSGTPAPFKPHQQEYLELSALREESQDYPLAERALQDKSSYVHSLFYRGCNELPGTYIYWFDTFEAVRDDPVGRWLLEELPQSTQKLRLVIAGRPPENDQKKENGSFIQPYQLTGLNPSDIERFYQNRFRDELYGDALKGAAPDTDVWRRMCEKLNYHPLHIDLARLWADADLINYNELSYRSQDEIIRTLFERLQRIMRVPGFITPQLAQQFSAKELEDIEIAAYQVVLYMAFLDRRFNKRFLQAIYPDSEYTPIKYAEIALERMEQVPSIFFVKEREGGLSNEGYLQLHDEVRDRVLAILWEGLDPRREERTELAQKAIKVYDQIIQEAHQQGENRLREELRVEQLYYRLRVDLQKGYDQFEDDFERNIENQNWGICQLLLNEISEYL